MAIVADKSGNNRTVDKHLNSPSARVRILTQAEYDAILIKDENTLYVIPEVV